MKIKVDCPSALYEITEGTIVNIRNITSHVSDGSYLACEYDGKIIGMCDDIPELMNMKEEDYVEARVISSTVVYMNTTLTIELL